MIPLFSTDQVRTIDSYAINDIGIPGIILMENAALSIVSILSEKILSQKRITKVGILCGRGNNGGDGFAVARHLANRGLRVVVIYIGKPDDFSDDCRANFNILTNLSVTNKNILIKKYDSQKSLFVLSKCELLLDALLGSGAKGLLRKPYSTIIDYVNKLPAVKVAIDIPTGLDADTGFYQNAFKANYTITLGEFKKGLFFGGGSEVSGSVFKGDIGIDQTFFNRFEVKEYLVEPEDILLSLPEKKKSIHKYSAGKVLTIAGSRSLPSAAVLTSKSVMKIGAGASILAFPKSIRNLIQKKLDEVIVEEYDDNNSGELNDASVNIIEDRIKWADVIAVGPGLGRSENTQQAIKHILKLCTDKKVVLDADALYAIRNGIYKQMNLKNFVITPHLGEFSKLISISSDEIKKDLLLYGRAFVKETGAILILKGAPTIIITPSDEVFINTSGNPGMAKFGTGDVLTGALAGMMSMQENTEDAVIAAVYLHSLAADLLLRKYTEFGYTAQNILKNLPAAINFLRKSFAEVS